MSFNIEHRPKDFNEIIGNQDIIESLASFNINEEVYELCQKI